MFNFIKKAAVPGVADKDDKEKRKRDKKDRKEKQKRERASMSREELLRLDEVRRSLKIRGRRKDKEKLPSGITADYTADFLASLEQQQRSDSPHSCIDGAPPSEGGTQQSDSSETSLNSLTGGVQQGQRGAGLPPVPPRPPKRGILKAPRVSVTADNLQAVASHTNGFSDHHPHAPLAASDDDTRASLIRNTLQNELIGYQNLQQHYHQNGVNGKPPATSLSNQLLVITSTSASADSLTDTTNSSFATPPFSLSPVGESQGFHRWSRTSNLDDLTLPLPLITAAPPPPIRELRVRRQPPPRSDFGFSLRRAMALERAAADGAVRARAVIFAEPGAHAQHRNDTGLLPGDRLLEVNGTPVGDRQREEVIEMIRASGDYVVLKVRNCFILFYVCGAVIWNL
ncbi:unnamed protein product [Acanthoscelides obtectus]|uniref:PDZ domain-containing protein n=1 Tax=Acanthoscelides obtectus TaxID=200917 RepID=A0A9P0LYB8_ACAOB|nr:unnamed protein product [Acanthoscelides obtectus]CAK1664632.1 Unconventional myosin-XVIIIa [Acanthoscelides obtectus]